MLPKYGMRYTEIIAENRTAYGQTLPKGPISNYPIANTGELGQLEDALCLWVEGECAVAEPHLMKLLRVMARFKATSPTLYRGIVMDTGKEVLAALKDGITITHRGKAMESWSDDPMKVDEFMAGWDRPWIMITCPSNRLNVLIDLPTFNEQAHPFTEMKSQGEVIVLAEPSVHFTADQISIPGFSIDELRDYEYTMDRSLDESYHLSPIMAR